VLAVRRVTRIFGASGAARVPAVDSLDLEIRANEVFTLLGPSGYGKTTLLGLIAGAYIRQALPLEIGR
jgi:spermidine/putrescine transport system ATP-binding protein